MGAGKAISSVVYGQNIEKGLASGAIGALTGMAVAAVTSAAIASGKSLQVMSWEQWVTKRPYDYVYDLWYNPKFEYGKSRYH